MIKCKIVINENEQIKIALISVIISPKIIFRVQFILCRILYLYNLLQLFSNCAIFRDTVAHTKK